MNTEFFDEFLDKQKICEWLKESKKAMDSFFKWKDKHGAYIKNKLASEIFSSLLESKGKDVFEKYYDGELTNAHNDDQPDLSFDGLPLEIKVTNGETWTGGEYSKRPSNYLLVARNEDFTRFFVCLTYIDEGEWISGGENYYGTSFNKKQLIEKEIKTIYKGDIRRTYSKDGQEKGIKLDKMH